MIGRIRRTLGCIAVATFLLAVGRLVAQEEAEYAAPSMDEMMAVMAEAGAPGEMHELLARTAGTWTTKVKLFLDPSAPPTEIDGTSTTEMTMGGRWATEHAEGQMMGMPFKGLGITGFNNVTQQFEATWIDNMSTTLYTYTGSMTEDGDGIVMQGSFEDPMTGETVTQRSVLTFVDDDHYMVEGFDTRGGTETRTMEIHYWRAEDSM